MRRVFLLLLLCVLVAGPLVLARASTVLLIDGTTRTVFAVTRDVYAYHGWFGVSIPSAYVLEVN